MNTIILLLAIIGAALSQNVIQYPQGTFPYVANTRNAHPLGPQYATPGIGNLGYSVSRGINGGRSYTPLTYPQPPYTINPAGNWQRYFPNAQASRILLPRHNSGLSGASLYPQQSISALGGPRRFGVAPGIVPSIASANIGRLSASAPFNAPETPASRLQSRLQLLRSLRSRRTGEVPSVQSTLTNRARSGGAYRQRQPEVTLRQLRGLNLGLDNRQLRSLLRRGGLSALEPNIPDFGQPIPDISFDRSPKQNTKSAVQHDLPKEAIQNSVDLPKLPSTKFIKSSKTVSSSKPKPKPVVVAPARPKPVVVPARPVIKAVPVPTFDKILKPTIVKSARPCPRKDYSPCVTSDEFNRRALKCCRTLPSIPQGCYHLCSMDVTPFQITRALQSGQCPVGAFQPFLICLSEGKDLNPCCDAHRLTKGRKDVCSAFCNPQQGFNPNAGFQYLRCIGQFRKLAACYWSSMN